MSDFLINDMRGREILDSRGRPTVEADITLAGGVVGRASVPSGASTGSLEALELRDGDRNRFRGNGVLTAVDYINGEIREAILGRDVRSQRELDELLIKLDGSKDSTKSRLGANAVLAVSLAAAHSACAQAGIGLYRYIRESLFTGSPDPKCFLLPSPMLNFVNGGAHANNTLDFQEFMLVPHGAGTFEEAVQWASEVYLCLTKEVRMGRGLTFGSYGVGDEGGFSITTPRGMSPKKTVEFVFDLLSEFVAKAGHSIGLDADFAFALDPAASEFYRDGKYVLGQEGDSEPEYWSSEDLVGFYEELHNKYPIVSIEDGMAENDDAGWASITERLSDRCQLVGDDLFVTNPAIFARGIDNGIANAILVKVNQIGTLTEALEVIRIAQDAGYNVVVSHRSGETEDTTISDIAVGTNAGQIKTGCLSRAERASKYNRLLMISQELGSRSAFEGHAALSSYSYPKGKRNASIN